ncbi:MAG: hypothetical protein JW759_08795, partial [Candidatus Coatesbacteria bacterium]|nr:hypothetical protein [Candidatus Coatesbacteria bacterium]
WGVQDASSKDVEAKIEIGVAASKAEEAMNARQPVTAFKLLLDLVKKYPGNVSALHKYYDFLLNHRIKLRDEERGQIWSVPGPPGPTSRLSRTCFWPSPATWESKSFSRRSRMTAKH